MKKNIFILLSALILFDIGAYTIRLKEKAFVDNNEIRITDLIEEKEISQLRNLSFITIDRFPYKICNMEIVNFLLSREIYEVNVIGNSVIVYKKSNNYAETETSENSNSTRSKNDSPIRFLEKYLNSIFNDKNIIIKIELVKTEPAISLEDISGEYHWELKKMDYGLKDLEKIKRIPVVINSKKYDITVDLKVFANILMSKKNFSRYDYFNINGFEKSFIDITIFKNINTIVTDFSGLDKTKFIKNMNSGEILRWDHLTKIPVVKQGESLYLVVKKDNFTVTMPCTILENGFENKKVRIKLNNGIEKFGILKINQEKYYVEIL